MVDRKITTFTRARIAAKPTPSGRSVHHRQNIHDLDENDDLALRQKLAHIVGAMAVVAWLLGVVLHFV